MKKTEFSMQQSESRGQKTASSSPGAEVRPPKPFPGFYFSVCISWLLFFCALSGRAQVVPLVHAHAHNDYQHARPLFDALACGLCSVEADVHLVDGQLLVAHVRFLARAGRTLQSLYLDPLREQVRKNGGHVYPNGPEFTLLVELKDDWQTSYSTLHSVLTNYADILTTYESGQKHLRAVTVVITGNRSPDMFKGESVRYAALDGDLPDLNSTVPADLVPWVSSNWSSHFKWRGSGPMPEGELQKLQDIVAKAHQQGRRVRFWGAPDKPPFWQMLRTNQVDLINTDDLPGVQKFLLAEQGSAKITPQAGKP